VSPTDVDSSTAPIPERSADFVEALARGLEVITTFSSEGSNLTVSDVASRAGLARPTARRLLMTLEALGYARSHDGWYSLTTRVLELGTAGIQVQGTWEVARPHMVRLVDQVGESSSMSQLVGSDIVYMARVPVRKIIAFTVTIGTRFPAVATSMGQVLLSDLDEGELAATLATPPMSAVIPRLAPSGETLRRTLAEVRERGWALSDELLSVGVRSIAAPVKNHADRTVAAMNVTVHAAETSVDRLVSDHLPRLLETAEHVSLEWSNLGLLPLADPTGD